MKKRYARKTRFSYLMSEKANWDLLLEKLILWNDKIGFLVMTIETLSSISKPKIVLDIDRIVLINEHTMFEIQKIRYLKHRIWNNNKTSINYNSHSTACFLLAINHKSAIWRCQQLQNLLNWYNQNQLTNSYFCI